MVDVPSLIETRWERVEVDYDVLIAAVAAFNSILSACHNAPSSLEERAIISWIVPGLHRYYSFG